MFVWKWESSVGLCERSAQCQLCSRWPFGLPQLEFALPRSGWDLPGAPICASAAASAPSQRNAKSSLLLRAKNKIIVFGSNHSSRIHRQVRESTFTRLLQSRAPKPRIPWSGIETPAQGTLGVALDGRGFVAESLHIFGTGLLSRRPKVFK